MLTTERLILRSAEMRDLDDLHAIMRDPRAMTYWSTLPHPDVDTTRTQLAKMTARAAPVTYFMFEHDGRVIGMGGMHDRNEIGYILHPDYWRQGFLREAMGAIIPYLWETTPHATLFADTDPRNAASIGLLQALGFLESGRAARTYCVDGIWADSVYFTLARPTD